MSPRPEPPRVPILGTPVTAARFDDALHALERSARTREPAVFHAATAYSVVLARREPEYRRCVAAADFVMADGMPLVWAARWLGHHAERVHGDDFLLAFCQRHRDLRHYLLGGRPGQPEAARDALVERYPGLQVVGAHATPTRPLTDEQSERVAGEIEGSDADVVWVGMGTPHQDVWMAANRARLGRPLVGVGSAFDLLTGHKRPAPEWMKRSGLQWLFRLMEEPGRLGPRYLVYNSLFIAYLARQLLSERLRPIR